MRYIRIAFCLILIGITFKVYSSLSKAHEFKKTECIMCHVDVEKNIANLKPITASVCEKCHDDRKQKLSHPIEIVPVKSIPADMVTVNGRLSCVTCHFVHPFSVKNKRFSKHFLRRPGRGIIFCSTCHIIDDKGHVVFEKIHTGTFKVTNPNGTLDDYTLQCIECHDRHIDKISHTTGSGKWEHFSLKLNHPLGVSLKRVAAENPKEFNLPDSLPEEIRLFNNKIGCGTCHNVYSKEKYMLVTSNSGSGLCRNCHIK